MRFTIFFLLCCGETSWSFSIAPHIHNHHQKSNVCKSNAHHHSTILLHQSATPFEMNYYGDEDTKNPYLEDISPLAVRSDTQLVIGLNKYSHDTSICAADASTGEVLLAVSKERLTRKKHDSGNVAKLVEKCLDCLDLDFDAIQKVVINNHHHRVLPMEANRRHMEWECGVGINGGTEDGYDDDDNVFQDIDKHEISHHLAHAYSAATQSPFDSGLVVVMDGMGETYRTMLRATMTKDTTYTSDLSLGTPFQFVPHDLAKRIQYSYFDWREAESVYTFTKSGAKVTIKPVFKRFQEEKTPPTLYNHGFENMDSVGALYSRASSHVFGDWNACGKLMGLAPWIDHQWTNDDNGNIITPARVIERRIMKGNLYEDEGLKINRSMMEGLPCCARNDADLFDENMMRRKRYDFDDDDGSTTEPKLDEEGQPKPVEKKRLPAKVALDAIKLASRIQDDLEDVVIDFVKHFQEETGEKNLVLTGGVALNSVLNGRLAREMGFERTFIPPYPGDDGIAVGCCAFGLYGDDTTALESKSAVKAPPVWESPLSPYLGPEPSEFEIKAAIQAVMPWLEVETLRSEDSRVEKVLDEIEAGGIVALYQGRSEMGPRALGHRSILADPRKKGIVRFINQYVKKRESFRPFAPSVLAEEAHNWFDLKGTNEPENNVSPYMSMTAYVKESKRSQIPAVTHVDGSSRLQTVTTKDEPFYHKIISGFFARTGVPMVLNTSFNTIPGEPIVETPQDAIRSFLNSMGSVDLLIMGDYAIRRKVADVRKLFGEGTESTSSETIQIPAARPIRTGPVEFQSGFDLKAGRNKEEDTITTTKVRMPSRPMHHDEKNNWFQLTDEFEGEILSILDGQVSINDLLAFFTMKDESEEYTEDEMEETKLLLDQITKRIVRLYEHTFISW